MSFIIIFIVKLIDQILRTSYLIAVKKSKKYMATILVGLQQIIHIFIIVYIIQDTTILNVLALVSSTMLGTFIINNKFNQGGVK